MPRSKLARCCEPCTECQVPWSDAAETATLCAEVSTVDAAVGLSELAAGGQGSLGLQYETKLKVSSTLQTFLINLSNFSSFKFDDFDKFWGKVLTKNYEMLFYFC